MYFGFLDLIFIFFFMLLDNYVYILKDFKFVVVVDLGDLELVIVSFLLMLNIIILCI